jgi:hypothetical protein
MQISAETSKLDTGNGRCICDKWRCIDMCLVDELVDGEEEL